MDLSKCLIIAEAGVNHNGSLDLALKLCDAAKETGVDVVKFQTWKTENLITKDVMTRNPKTVNADSIATKALAIMEKYSITSLAVVDENNKPVGLIHVHDLLKEGVA